MARYSDTVVDQFGNAVSGVQVSIYPRATPTVLATLTDDAGSPLGNPISTASDGLFAFNAPTGDYILSFKLASASRPFHTETVNLNDAIRGDLATDAGATLVNHKRAATGALTRTIADFIDDQPISVKDFGAVGDYDILTGTGTDNTAALTAALAAQAGGATLEWPEGWYRVTGNLPGIFSDTGEGADVAFDLKGAGRFSSVIVFDGAPVTTGLTYTGSSYSDRGPRIRGLGFYCVNGAKRGLTIQKCAESEISENWFFGAQGAGLFLNAVLTTQVTRNRFHGCVSATEAPLVVTAEGTANGAAFPTSTTVTVAMNRFAGSNAGCIAAIMVDRTIRYSDVDNAIESSGIGWLIASRTESVYGCQRIRIVGANAEALSPYIKAGSGWTGTAGKAVVGGTIAFAGSISDLSSIPIGVQLYNCSGLRFEAEFDQPAGSTCSYSFEGTGNAGIIIDPARNMFGKNFPYVKVNGTRADDASPLVRWVLGQSTPYNVQTSQTLSAAPGTLNLNAEQPTALTQGGIYGKARVTFSGGDLSFISGGAVQGMSVRVIFANSGTIKNGAGGGAVNSIITKTGADVTAVAGPPYVFDYDSATGKWGLA